MIPYAPFLLRFSPPPPPEFFISPPHHLIQYYVLSHVVNIVAFLPQPFPLRRLFFVCLSAYTTWLCFGATSGLGLPMDYAIVITATGQFLRMFNFLVCSGPPEENLQLTRPGVPGWEGRFKDWSTLQRARCAADFFNNVRGPGWGWRFYSKWERNTPQLTRWYYAPHPRPHLRISN